MNPSLNIIPTPQSCRFAQGGGIQITKVFADFPITGPLEAGLSLLNF